MSKSPTNIIIFVNSFWNNGDGMSGGDQIILQVYGRIRQNFDRVLIFTSHHGKTALKRQLKNVEFVVSNKSWDKFNIIVNYFFRTIQALKCLLIRSIDVIHSSSDFAPDVIPGFVYCWFNSKTKWVVNVMHIYPNWDDRPGNKFQNFVAQFMQKFSFLLIKRANLIVALNQQVKQELVTLGHDPQKIIIIRAGIDLNYFKNLDAGNERTHYEATFLARLKPSKGIFDLIKIWTLVIKKKPQAQLAIIGGGGNSEVLSQLKTAIKASHLEKNIKLLGYLSNDQSFRLIKNSSLFLFPSHEEGFGIAIAEAMACGVPVVAWNLKIYEEIFADQIVKVKENDISGMSATIIELLENHKKRQKIGLAAQSFINQYSWEDISREYAKILI